MRLPFLTRGVPIDIHWAHPEPRKHPYPNILAGPVNTTAQAVQGPRTHRRAGRPTHPGFTGSITNAPSSIRTAGVCSCGERADCVYRGAGICDACCGLLADNDEFTS